MREKKRLEWSRTAERDLAALHDYIAADNRKAAESVVRLILASAGRLVEFPMLGHEGGDSGTRELVLPKYPYTLIYRVYPAKIRIVTVLHHSRKYP